MIIISRNAPATLYPPYTYIIQFLTESLEERLLLAGAEKQISVRFRDSGSPMYEVPSPGCHEFQHIPTPCSHTPATRGNITTPLNILCNILPDPKNQNNTFSDHGRMQNYVNWSAARTSLITQLTARIRTHVTQEFFNFNLTASCGLCWVKCYARFLFAWYSLLLLFHKRGTRMRKANTDFIKAKYECRL